MGDIITGYHNQHVAFLKISSPKTRNALTLEMWARLPEKLRNLSDNSNVRAIIISGDGTHFSSGGDISEFETIFSNITHAEQFNDLIDTAFHTLMEIPIPTIAQVRGGAVGGGCGLSLACDIRIADETAYFSIPPAKLGIVYPYSEIQRLVSTIGLTRAKDMLFSARKINCEEALRIGLINQCYTSNNLEEEVLNYANILAVNSPNSLTKTKNILSHIESGNNAPTDTILADIQHAFLSDDFKEGYSAFLQKRKPRF